MLLLNNCDVQKDTHFKWHLFSIVLQEIGIFWEEITEQLTNKNIPTKIFLNEFVRSVFNILTQGIFF